MKIYPYKMASRGAKLLAQTLDVKRIRREGKELRKPVLVVNWGSSLITRGINATRVLNDPYSVQIASNKLWTFDLLKGSRIPIPPFATSKEWALEQLAKGKHIVARHILNGHSGAGIMIHSDAASLLASPIAPLYTQYIKKEGEYRLHVFGGNVFFVQKKVRKKEVPDEKVNWKVRNHGNGFAYAHKDVAVSDAVKGIAVDAIKALGLDFGGVDMIHTKSGKWYVLEVNTACGLEGETLTQYAKQFKEYENA